MLVKTDTFWGYSAKDILTMPFPKIKDNILQAAAPLSVEEVVVAVVKRRNGTTSEAEKLACNRITSAMIGGPDVLEY